MPDQFARQTLQLTAATAAQLALCLKDKRAPEWIMVVPAGETATLDGRKFINDAPAAIVEAFDSLGIDLPVDFEHASEITRGSGTRYPVAGYVKELKVVEGAVHARVEWSGPGRQSIENGEYKYVSPAFLHTKTTLKVLKLTSVALTATPAYSILPALASSQQDIIPASRKEQDMDRKALCAKLGLDLDKVSDDQIITAIGKLQDDRKQALAAAETPALERFVPRADYDKVAGERDEARQTMATRDADDTKAKAEALVDQGIKDGKITPASKDFYLSTCATQAGMAEFEKFLASAPKVIPPKVKPKDPPGTGKAVLTAEQQQVAKGLGMSTEDYAASLAAEAVAAGAVAAETQEA